MTTTITSVNFKRYSKKLHKSLKEHNIHITLSSAQEIFSKVLGFNDCFSINKQFMSNDTNIKIDDYHKYYNRFLLNLSLANIKIDGIIITSIFSEFLGLDIEHKPSIMQTISQLKELVNNEINIKKCLVLINLNTNFIGFTIISDEDHPLLMLMPKNKDGTNQNSIKEHIDANKYQNIHNLFPYFLSKLLHEESSIPLLHTKKYISLLDNLFSYPIEEIFESFKTNSEKFIFSSENTYCLKDKKPIVLAKLQPMIINDKILNKFYLIIENCYLNGEYSTLRKESGKLIFSPVTMDTLLHHSRKLNCIDFGMSSIYPSLQSRVFDTFENCFAVYKKLKKDLNYKIIECNITEHQNYMISNIW